MWALRAAASGEGANVAPEPVKRPCQKRSMVMARMARRRGRMGRAIKGISQRSSVDGRYRPKDGKYRFNQEYRRRRMTGGGGGGAMARNVRDGGLGGGAAGSAVPRSWREK